MSKTTQHAIGIFVALLMLFVCSDAKADEPTQLIELKPLPYNHALRNPLKGFTTRGVDTDHEWATLSHDYLRWNELEDVESDTLQKIIDVCDRRWAGLAEKNIKVIPRVYLQWSGPGERYWPSDLQPGDYSSEEFQARLLRLIARLGQAWNEDPRVAFVELGIFGKWGEHHSPSPSVAIQKLAADAFAKAFTDKKVSVRHAWSEFQSQRFGEYWDSFAHLDQMLTHGRPIAELNRRVRLYRTNYIGGEAAYDWGNWREQPGKDPTSSVAVRKHREFLFNTIRWTHCTQLRWLADYDAKNQEARQGAELLQRAMGYRFVPTRFAFSPSITNGKLRVEVTIRNDGSAPFYYDWPVECSLLDLEDRSVVWKSQFAGVDIRTWLPGDAWTKPSFTNEDKSRLQDRVVWPNTGCDWQKPAGEYSFSSTFALDVPDGQYVLALAILDPAGMKPSVRLATAQYFNGGRHPIGLVSQDEGRGGELPSETHYDDPAHDDSLRYGLR